MNSVKKILLVDDSPTVLALERMVLGRAGYALVSANNGQEALALARTERPDLVLMDLSLPVVDGWEPDLEGRRGLPVFIAHGRRDPVMEVSFARRARELLETAGLVTRRREGRYTFHDLDTAPLAPLRERWHHSDERTPR